MIIYTPYTTHLGGLLGICKKVINSALLNFEELYTLLLQAEACLNSRPLTKLSSDPSEHSALTPAHFLIGGPLQSFSEQPDKMTVMSLSRRWQLIQRLRNQFWNRWSTEYLHLLQPRSKWWREKPILRVGDLAIVHEENTLSLRWPLGRIESFCRERRQSSCGDCENKRWTADQSN